MPKNELFIAKLNKATEDADLELIFSRFGRIESCDIVRDWKTGDSLNFAFIAFEEEKSDSASLHAIFMNRLRERRSWVVSFSILGGPRCSRSRSAQVLRGSLQEDEQRADR